MSVAAVLGRIVQMYGEFVGRSAIALVLVLAGLNFVFTVADATITETIWADLALAAATLLGLAWAESVLVLDIHDERSGRREASILELFGRTWRAALRVAWATFLAALVISLLFVVAFFFATLVVVDELTLIAALLVSATPALFLMARWSLLLPVIVIEQKTTSAAFARSTQLVLPHRWKVFVVVLIGLVVGVVFDTVLVEAAERFTRGQLEFWLTLLIDGLVYASLVVALSAALYYELLAAGSTHPPRSEWRDEHEVGDIDLTRFAR